jgi:DNA-nicking Smr family endonuclease
MSAGKELSMEDRILWSQVARSTKPLPGRKAVAPTAEPADFARMLDEAKTERTSAPPPAHTARPRADHARPHRLDTPTRQKLAKGRLPIEGKVDLHGLTQSEAHTLLLSFLHRAYADGRRYVLVVTGKGSSFGSDGALRRAVPVWLATPPFRALVGAHEDAGRRHGGSGALYVRLRRAA